MSRMVHCRKLHKELPGLDRAPLPGSLGERIFNEISAEAWAAWLVQQTMLINENRLQVAQPSARAFLRESMEQFLFSDVSAS